MTKKDYIKFAMLLAHAMYQAKISEMGSDANSAIDYITEEIEVLFYSENRKFDRKKFEEAISQYYSGLLVAFES